MRKVLFLLLMAAATMQAQVDPKEASSEKSSMMEGRLRDAKPSAERKLADGTEISVWILPMNDASGNAVKQIVKASARRLTPIGDEGTKTDKADLSYAGGKVSEVHYTETKIVQKPTPSVATNKRELIFTDGVQTSPMPGSFPDIEKFINDCLSEIAKIPVN